MKTRRLLMGRISCHLALEARSRPNNGVAGVRATPLRGRGGVAGSGAASARLWLAHAPPPSLFPRRGPARVGLPLVSPWPPRGSPRTHSPGFALPTYRNGLSIYQCRGRSQVPKPNPEIYLQGNTLTTNSFLTKYRLQRFWGLGVGFVMMRFYF